MSTAAVQYDLATLLEMAGARIRGRNRADCPACQRPRAVSFNESAFCCHGIDCEFRGGIGTLRQRLGLRREWLPKAEYIRQCQERGRVRVAAERLYAVAKARRSQLYDELRNLSGTEAGAHRAGPTEAAWGALGVVYVEKPHLLAELAILENCGAADLARFLSANAEARRAAISRVAERSGLVAADGKIIDVEY